MNQLSLLSAVKFDWSWVTLFEFNQLKNLKLSPFFRNPALRPKPPQFSLNEPGITRHEAGFFFI